MQSKYLNRLFLSGTIVLIIAASSCQKEPVAVPVTDETPATIMFIRAVEKDSSVVNSEQILLR